MVATIQLIAASPIAEKCRVNLPRKATIPSRAARCPAGIEVALRSASATHFRESGHRNRSEVMVRIRRFAIALFAASTVAIGSLAVPAQASAMPMSCEVRYALSDAYYATAQVFYALGDYTTAFFWVGKSYGIVEGCH